ncbi:MAG TPA: glycosyltransferase family 4 protein [Gemmatimonadales bacterium]|nr:glycosyltransferase family 4 protein [Gemmatimonadales bacterium]
MSDGLYEIRGARIAQLIESDGPGGAERCVVNLASHLQAAGCYSVIILPARGEGWLGREAAAAGVTVEPFDLERPISPSCVRELRGIFRKHRITLAHTHEFTMAVYGGVAAWRAHIGHVATMHGGRYYAARLRRRVALRGAVQLGHGVLVAVSDPLARHLSHDLWMARERVLTVPNGVSWEAEPQPVLRRTLGVGAEDRLIVAVGNLYPVKGHRYLLEALGRLAERVPRVYVAIAGRGDLEPELRAQAAALGVADRVRFLGLRDDVPSLLAAADVYALPSLSEGLPLSLLEAMFAGRAIVASDVGEVRTVLGSGDAGVIVAPGQSAELATAIEWLLSNPREAAALGERAAQRARADYDVSSMVRRYAEIYRGLLRAVVIGPAASSAR